VPGRDRSLCPGTSSILSRGVSTCHGEERGGAGRSILP
jgi:hypothetical protein